MKFTKILLAASAAGFLGLAGVGTAVAGPVACPDSVDTGDREMTIDEAQLCGFQDGNPQSADVNALMGSLGWYELEKIERADGASGSQSEGILTIELAAGDTWGEDPDKMVEGTWEITDPNFWSTYSEAVLSFHWGGGQGDPDGFMFSLTPGVLSGSWTYDGSCCNGGGLSNVKLWVNEVPEPGTLMLLGAGLVGLGLRRRRTT